MSLPWLSEFCGKPVDLVIRWSYRLGRTIPRDERLGVELCADVVIPRLSKWAWFRLPEWVDATIDKRPVREPVRSAMIAAAESLFLLRPNERMFLGESGDGSLAFLDVEPKGQA
jgi:hypothetical protein